MAHARHEQALTRAVDARKLVGQAMGIVMERYDLDGDQAFAVLRRCSQDTNTKLHLIARELIETRTLPGRYRPADPAAPISVLRVAEPATAATSDTANRDQ